MFTRSFLLTLIAILLIVAIIRIPFRNLSLSLGVVCLVGLQNPHQLLDEIRSLILCFGRFAHWSLAVARWSLVGFAQSGKKLLHAVTCRLLFLDGRYLLLLDGLQLLPNGRHGLGLCRGLGPRNSIRLAVLDLGKFLGRLVLQKLLRVHARVVLVDAIAPLRCRESLESRHVGGWWFCLTWVIVSSYGTSPFRVF